MAAHARGRERASLTSRTYPRARRAAAGGFLIVDKVQGDADGDPVGKVQATLAHHLYRDQIRHLQGRGLWPADFETEAEPSEPRRPTEGDEYGALGGYELHVNTNRCGVDESDEDSSDEDEDEGVGEGEGGGDGRRDVAGGSDEAHVGRTD